MKRWRARSRAGHDPVSADKHVVEIDRPLSDDGRERVIGRGQVNRSVDDGHLPPLGRPCRSDHDLWQIHVHREKSREIKKQQKNNVLQGHRRGCSLNKV